MDVAQAHLLSRLTQNSQNGVSYRSQLAATVVARNLLLRALCRDFSPSSSCERLKEGPGTQSLKEVLSGPGTCYPAFAPCPDPNRGVWTGS